MKLQLAAIIAVVLLAVIYVSMGLAVYVNDIARGWCNLDFSFENLGAYLIVWPFRLFYGDAYCD